ncbi:MAG: hypothetical protein IPP71_21825 [Bacteroidetes bacterium]|nr:hypothetical protein [Bacteroidota bacterium]
MENQRIATLKIYIEEDPKDLFSRYALALEYINSGNDTEAQKIMEALHHSYPDYLANYYHYGKLLERSGNIEKAIAIFTEGEKLAAKQKNQKTYNELRGAREELED